MHVLAQHGLASYLLGVVRMGNESCAVPGIELITLVLIFLLLLDKGAYASYPLPVPQ